MSLLNGRTSPLSVTRLINTIPYVAGGQQTLDIPREDVLLGLSMRLKFTVTAGSSAMVGPLFMPLARLFKRIEMTAGGRDTFINISGAALAARVFYEQGVHARGIDDTFVLTGTGTVTNYDIVLPLDFTLQNGRREDDAALDTRGLSQLSLMVSWGTIDDLVTTPNGAAISNVSCSVEGVNLLNVPAAAAYLVRSLVSVESTLTGSSDNFRMVLDSGTGLVYRNLMVLTTEGNVGSDSVLSTATGKIRLECGSFVQMNADPVMIKAKNRLSLKQTPLTGVYFLDLLYNGQIVTAVSTAAIPTDWVAIFNATKLTGTTVITICEEAVRPFKLN